VRVFVRRGYRCGTPGSSMAMMIIPLRSQTDLGATREQLPVTVPTPKSAICHRSSRRGRSVDISSVFEGGEGDSTFPTRGRNDMTRVTTFDPQTRPGVATLGREENDLMIHCSTETDVLR
jgi:hypothetical protein